MVPFSLLPPDEKERRRRDRDRILDLLEEEERLQQVQEERDAEEERKEAIKKRKESAKAELDRLKTAHELQKKMGQALVRNAKSKGENEHGMPVVSTAEAQKYPMNMHVVERRPTATPASPSHDDADSDDESTSSAGHPLPHNGNDSSDEEVRSSSGDNDLSDDEPLEEGFDYDTAQHHGEIALEYHKKRRAIGAETAKVMTAHTLDDYEQHETVSHANRHAFIEVNGSLSSSRTVSCHCHVSERTAWQQRTTNRMVPFLHQLNRLSSQPPVKSPFEIP